jgi:hypothetical protein
MKTKDKVAIRLRKRLRKMGRAKPRVELISTVCCECGGAMSAWRAIVSTWAPTEWRRRCENCGNVETRWTQP